MSEGRRYTAAEWREKLRQYRANKRIKEEQEWRRNNPHEARRNDDQRSLNVLENALHDLRKEYADLLLRSTQEIDRLRSRVEELEAQATPRV